MAKFLIYNKVHWMELPSKSAPDKTGYERNVSIINSKLLSTAAKITELTKLDDTRARVQVQGDIVEIRNDEDKMCGLEPETFLLVSVPDMSDEQAKEYTGPLMNEDTLLKMFKYSLDTTGLNFNNDNEITIQSKTFMERLTVKK